MGNCHAIDQNSCLNSERPFGASRAVGAADEISRSRLFVLALEEYIKRSENRELLEKINAAYSDEPDPEEEALLLRHIKREHRRLVEGEW